MIRLHEWRKVGSGIDNAAMIERPMKIIRESGRKDFLKHMTRRIDLWVYNLILGQAKTRMRIAIISFCACLKLV